MKKLLQNFPYSHQIICNLLYKTLSTTWGGDNINSFISNAYVVTQLASLLLRSIMDEPRMDDATNDIIRRKILTTTNIKSVPIEIDPWKNININPNLSPTKIEKLI